jgi:hypothetical protein
MAKKNKKTYVMVGGARSQGSAVFYKLHLPSGNTAWVMNQNVYRKSLRAADQKLREVIAKRKSAAA